MTDRSIVDTWENLIRYHHATVAKMDDRLMSTFGHSLEDYDVLYQLSVHNEPMRMGELAERLLVANSSCHRIVARLVDADLIARHRGESDGRVVQVELTPDGRRLRRRMAAVHTRDIRQLFGNALDAEDHEALDRALEKLCTG